MNKYEENINVDSFFEYIEEDEEDIVEYDITTSPRDWNPSNIVDLIDSGIMELPLFQRNYIWDIKKASRLIESLILGLPIPELFVYVEGDENSTYKIIDGQQRILTIYFFMKGKFPKNSSVRNLIKEGINNPKQLSDLMNNKKYFKKFALELAKDDDRSVSRYHGLDFESLDKDMKIKLKLRRYLRVVAIRQNKPDNDNASMFEIFNRLNSGGVKLTPQEIRASLYYCDFYNMITELNENLGWRGLLDNTNLDLHSGDIQLILRGFALLHDSQKYAPKMESFLNKFSQKSKSFDIIYITYLRDLFLSFIRSCENLDKRSFFINNKFSITLFEAIFVAACGEPLERKELITDKINKDSFDSIKNDSDFKSYQKSASSSTESVINRLNIAGKMLKFDKEND